MNGKEWLKVFATLFLLGVLFVGWVNYVVDPYGLKSNENKFDSDLMLMNKPNLTSLKIHLIAEYYLIGTSRVMRINPNLIEKYLPQKKVYNINISGATFKENSMLAKKVLSNGSNFIYGFDAFSLNKNRLNEKEIVDRYMSYKSELENKSIYGNYLNIDTLSMSFKNLVKKILNKNYNSYSFSENNKIHDAVTILGIEEHLDLSNKGTKKSSSNFEIVNNNEIINLAKNATKKDIFIIYPKHFYHYILFQKYQNIETKYFNAIKLLVQNTDAKVWCFYGKNEITVNDGNFDENGWHFKPKIAELIFAKIFNDPTIEVPKDFGVLVTKENIDEHLKNLREQVQNYDLNKSLSLVPNVPVGNAYSE